MVPKNSYLKIGTAKDLHNLKDKIIFRLLEIFPGFLSWGFLFIAVFLSYKRPLWIALFIITFTIFWFFRTIYFSLLLWIGFKKMEKNKAIDWIEKLNSLPITAFDNLNPEKGVRDWKKIYQLIVIPIYKESLEIMRDTFRALEKVDFPKNRMIVVLACEERAKSVVEQTARQIEKEFGSSFFKFMVTWHPFNLPGEIVGKGSNETWSALQAREKIIDPEKIPYQNIIFSSFDGDTCVFPKYFSSLTYQYLTSEKPLRTSFQPIPLYINNAWQASVVSRVFAFSSTFWHTMNQGRPEKLITFSSHSMSFYALNDVGFKQTNVVSDDSRIFWQCFLKYDGDYRVKPLYYPVSMDANVAQKFFKTLLNIYKQQKRWAYGVGDIAYFLFGFYKNKKIPFAKKFFLAYELIEGHLSWATVSIIIFLLGWLPLFLGGQEFSHTLISYNLPRAISGIMTLTMSGLLLSVYISFILIPPKPPECSRFKYLMLVFGWALFPIMMIFFTALPALEAQTRWMLGRYMGFWVTEKHRK
jgi:hypothetical protein